MVVDRHAQDFLGVFLPYDVFVQSPPELGGRFNLEVEHGVHALGPVLHIAQLKGVVEGFNACRADERAVCARNERSYFARRTPAKAASLGVFGHIKRRACSL